MFGVITSQCILTSKHDIMHLKYIQCLFVNHTSLNLGSGEEFLLFDVLKKDTLKVFTEEQLRKVGVMTAF